jgi:transposase
MGVQLFHQIFKAGSRQGGQPPGIALPALGRFEMRRGGKAGVAQRVAGIAREQVNFIHGAIEIQGGPARVGPGQWQCCTCVQERVRRKAKEKINDSFPLSPRRARGTAGGRGFYDGSPSRPCAPTCGGQKGGSEARAIGRSRGGLTTKIHAVVDALGNPLRFILTPGHVSDFTKAEELIADLPADHVLADKGYDSTALRDAIRNQHAVPVIPHRKTSPQVPCDYALYCERNLVSAFIGQNECQQALDYGAVGIIFWFCKRTSGNGFRHEDSRVSSTPATFEMVSKA